MLKHCQFQKSMADENPAETLYTVTLILQLILLFTVPALTVMWFYSVQSSMVWGSFSSNHQIQAVRMLGYKLRSYTCSHLVKILSSKSWSAFAIKQTKSVYKTSVQIHWGYIWKLLPLINRSKPITAEKKVSRTMYALTFQAWHRFFELLFPLSISRTDTVFSSSNSPDSSEMQKEVEFQCSKTWTSAQFWLA